MTDNLPPLASLYAFSLIAQHGGLAAAARLLNVTQPAVSKRIRRLEDHLGTALLQRKPNGVELTAAGRSLARALAPGFRTIRDAAAAASRASGPLRVHAHSTWALRWLIPRLPRLRARHPALEVEVSTSVLPFDFARDAMDVVIWSAPDPPQPGAEKLMPLDIAPFAPADLVRSARSDGLRGHRLLGSRARPDDWRLWCTQAGTKLPSAPLLFESTALAVQAAIEGLGIVIAPPVLVADAVRRRQLVRLARRTVRTGAYYWLVLPPGPGRAEAHAFRMWLREEVTRALTAGRRTPGAGARSAGG